MAKKPRHMMQLEELPGDIEDIGPPTRQDYAEVIAIIAILVVVVAMIVGGVWWIAT
jgi:hypothetical protein